MSALRSFCVLMIVLSVSGYWPGFPLVERQLDKVSQSALIESARAEIKERINKNLPQPQSSLAYGLLFGQGARFEKEFLNNLRRTGTSHLVAVSGYNVSIFINLLLAPANLLINKAFLVLGLGSLAIYSALVDFSPSVLRALIMGLFLVLARLLGRQRNATDALILSAALILIITPKALTDLGFQLSFLSMAGLVYLSPIFHRIFNFLPKLIRTVVADSLAAQIMVLPVVVFNFGRVSFVALLANLFVFWAVPAAMVLTLADLVFGGLAPVFLWGNLVVLEYFVGVIRFLSHLPWASISF